MSDAKMFFVMFLFFSLYSICLSQFFFTPLHDLTIPLGKVTSSLKVDRPCQCRGSCQQDPECKMASHKLTSNGLKYECLKTNGDVNLGELEEFTTAKVFTKVEHCPQPFVSVSGVGCIMKSTGISVYEKVGKFCPFNSTIFATNSLDEFELLRQALKANLFGDTPRFWLGLTRNFSNIEDKTLYWKTGGKIDPPTELGVYPFYETEPSLTDIRLCTYLKNDRDFLITDSRCDLKMGTVCKLGYF